jgi:hypothetical protein
MKTELVMMLVNLVLRNIVEFFKYSSNRIKTW